MVYFTIKHNIAGRLRLKIHSRSMLHPVENACAPVVGVFATRINPACGSLLILYDHATVQGATLLQVVTDLFHKSPTATVAKFSKILAVQQHSTAKSISPTMKNLGRFLSLSAVMGYIFTKEVILKAAVVQTAFSPLGLISLLASVPLLKESLKHIQEKRFTLEGFLAGGCALATLSGQAVTALEILWIQSGAETLKSWVAERSRKSISGILDLTAKNTFVLRGNVEIEVPVEAVQLRDIVVLHTGEKVSVDGVVISGDALIDDAPITGRAELSHAVEGQRVYAGSYVHQGLIHVRAECVGDKTYLARIMRQVEDSITSKAPIESVADNLAKSMVRLGAVATIGTLLFTGNLWRAFTVLMVMACPCATVLSAQTAISAAMSTAAKRGILIKGGRYLEEVGKANVVCFDKTGTLTTNQPRIEHIVNFSELHENELLRLAYSAEMHNHHPLAHAIKNAAISRDIDPISHVECDFTLGKGVRATIGESEVRIGNIRYLKEAGIKTSKAAKQVMHLEERGLTTIFLAKDATILGAFGFANETRPNAKATIRQLYASGVKKIVIITGDAKNTTLNLCNELQVEECHHSVLPEQKGQIISSLRNDGNKVIMVGDGINDALALTDADIGIALSAAGSDVAIEAADIALVHDHLSDIVYLRYLSQKTLRIARQNFWIATSTNIGGALAGALGLISPVAAGLIHIVHTLGVLGNSSRLLLPSSESSDYL